MMKKSLVVSIFSLIIFSEIGLARVNHSGYCLYLQHESTLFAGQGVCAYKFLFNSCYGNELKNVEITFSGRDLFNKKDVSEILKIDTIGTSKAEQYKERMVELPCSLTKIKITSASATKGEEKIDLLASKILQIDNSFKPLLFMLNNKSK